MPWPEPTNVLYAMIKCNFIKSIRARHHNINNNKSFKKNRSNSKESAINDKSVCIIIVDFLAYKMKLCFEYKKPFQWADTKQPEFLVIKEHIHTSIVSIYRFIENRTLLFFIIKPENCI